MGSNDDDVRVLTLASMLSDITLYNCIDRSFPDALAFETVVNHATTLLRRSSFVWLLRDTSEHDDTSWRDVSCISNSFKDTTCLAVASDSDGFESAASDLVLKLQSIATQSDDQVLDAKTFVALCNHVCANGTAEFPVLTNVDALVALMRTQAASESFDEQHNDEQDRQHLETTLSRVMSLSMEQTRKISDLEVSLHEVSNELCRMEEAFERERRCNEELRAAALNIAHDQIQSETDNTCFSCGILEEMVKQLESELAQMREFSVVQKHEVARDNTIRQLSQQFEDAQCKVNQAEARIRDQETKLEQLQSTTKRTIAELSDDLDKYKTAAAEHKRHATMMRESVAEDLRIRDERLHEIQISFMNGKNRERERDQFESLQHRLSTVVRERNAARQRVAELEYMYRSDDSSA